VKDVQVETMKERDRTPGERAERASTRTCVGCGKPGAPDDFVRIVLGPRGPDGASPVAVDLAGGGTHGRGARVHPATACLAKAAKSGLARSFKTKVAADERELAAEIVSACDRRIAGLLAGASRARMVAVGADAALDALGKSEATGSKAFVVVARDAASVIEKRMIAEAIAAGRAVAWADKKTLGAVFGREEVAVCVVTNDAVAQQVQRARMMSDGVASGAGPRRTRARGGAPDMTDDDGQRETRGEACRSREVR
jgi:predicted RNA-binding protein YlxR (DUF448 family)